MLPKRNYLTFWKVIANLAVMEQTDADTQLTTARRLAATSSRTAARWYVGYLVVYGIASFALASVFAFVDDTRLAALVTIPFWLVIVVGLSVWAARQRAAVRGFGVTHGVVIGVWAAAWAATVGLGTTVFAGVWQWFLGGGAVMAAAAFAGAYATHRKAHSDGSGT